MIPKALSLLLLAVGIFLLMQVVLPLAAFKVWELTVYDQSQVLVDPQSPGQVMGVKVEQVGNFPIFRVTNFALEDLPYQQFSLTIPKLSLRNIKVAVASHDFSQQLAHLPGTVLPGERGNIFISGHSAIAFRSPQDRRQAFFANLANLKKGDQVQVAALGQQFDYQVIGMRVVDPKETWVINPPDGEGRYLTLMTCVPPGFNSKRLVVLAKLKS